MVVVLRNTWFIESPVNCVQKVYNFTTVKLIDHAIIDSWSTSGRPTTPLVINILHNALAKHYSTCHKDLKAKLRFTILDQQQKHVRRKISEAIKINKDTPPLNNRDELVDTMKFIVR